MYPFRYECTISFNTVYHGLSRKSSKKIDFSPIPYCKQGIREKSPVLYYEIRYAPDSMIAPDDVRPKSMVMLETLPKLIASKNESGIRSSPSG